MVTLRFKRDTSFRNDLFTPESFAHPAKMDSQLLLWIVERYTQLGETILDPMFGSGTTMLACMLGRNVIGVELEQKFVDMAKANWEKVRQRPQLGSEMGECQIIQGDARQLEGLVDKVITSPPYTNRMDGGLRGSRAGMTPYTDESPDAWFTQRDQSNIGNLPYGTIDKIVTSPPYSDEPTISESYLKIRREIGRDTSKPSQQYRKYDSIIASPSYENQVHATREERATWNNPLDRDAKFIASLPVGYSDGENIGNLKSGSYLEAMLQVYTQCYTVLRPGGLMILITKNFIRNQKEVRLDEDTISLCEQAGLTFQERWYRELPSQSFWRVIYAKKYPDAPELKYEDVLVFVK